MLWARLPEKHLDCSASTEQHTSQSFQSCTTLVQLSGVISIFVPIERIKKTKQNKKRFITSRWQLHNALRVRQWWWGAGMKRCRWVTEASSCISKLWWHSTECNRGSKEIFICRDRRGARRLLIESVGVMRCTGTQRCAETPEMRRDERNKRGVIVHEGNNLETRNEDTNVSEMRPELICLFKGFKGE